MGAFGQDTQDVFGHRDCHKPRNRIAVDGVEQKDPTRLQHPRDFLRDLGKITDMLQHIHANNRIKAGIVIRQVFTNTYVVSDIAACGCGMRLCRLDLICGRVNTGDLGTPIMDRLGHETTRTTQIKHLFVVPVDAFVEPRQPRWHHVFQREHPAAVVRPRPISHIVIDRQIISFRLRHNHRVCIA